MTPRFPHAAEHSRLPPEARDDAPVQKNARAVGRERSVAPVIFGTRQTTARTDVRSLRVGRASARITRRCSQVPACSLRAVVSGPVTTARSATRADSLPRRVRPAHQLSTPEAAARVACDGPSVRRQRAQEPSRIELPIGQRARVRHAGKGAPTQYRRLPRTQIGARAEAALQRGEADCKTA